MQKPAGGRDKMLLETRRLSIGYGDIQVLWDIHLKIDEGEVIALAGSNGAGKTTLLKGLIGILKPLSGEISCSRTKISHPCDLINGSLWVSPWFPKAGNSSTGWGLKKTSSWGPTPDSMRRAPRETWTGSISSSPSWRSAEISRQEPFPEGSSRCVPSPAG